MTPRKLLEYAIFLGALVGVCVAGSWAARRDPTGP